MSGTAKPSPLEKYQILAAKLRNRIEFADFILASETPASQRAETVCLQGRMAVETIAYMCLVATEHGLGHLGIPRDAKKHWNAETIFRSLKSKNLNILPSPSRLLPSKDPYFKAVLSQTAEDRLNYDALIGIYRTFHEGLHEPNPYVQADSSTFYEQLMPNLGSSIDRLRRFTWIHFIGIQGEAFIVDLCNVHGLTVVLPLSKEDGLRPRYGQR